MTAAARDWAGRLQGSQGFWASSAVPGSSARSLDTRGIGGRLVFPAEGF